MSRTPTPPASLADFDQLRQILAGLAEGVILVGRKRDVLWANASACALHGVKTPSELGGTTAGYRRLFRLKYRNHHPLRAAQYPLERVAAGEIFDGVIVDVQAHADPDSHWVHRVRGQTILSPQGTADLHALFITDMTEWASAEHRFEKAFGANPAPAVICRIGDLRYVKVNPGFLQMTGFTSEQVVGRSTYELDVLAHAAARDDAIARLSA